MSKLAPEVIEKIKEYHDRGYSGYKIADLLGIGKTSAYKYTRQKSYPRWTDEEKQIVINGYARGWPVKKIVKKLDRRTVAGVKHIMHKHRKMVRGSSDIRIAAGLIARALNAGLPPGKALRKIRKHDVFNRAKKEAGADAL